MKYAVHIISGTRLFPHLLLNDYSIEDDSFKKTFSVIAASNVPHDTNVISSHTILKFKVDDDGSLKLKARIAPHGNEDSFKHDTRSYCAMCAPTVVRVLLSMATLSGWRVSTADVKEAFLQAGPAERPVYVPPPMESRYKKRFFWLIKAPAYGFVNANSKWKTQSDTLLLSPGLVTSNCRTTDILHEESQCSGPAGC